MASIKFYKKATEPSGMQEGGIWFDTSTQSIKVKKAEGFDVFGIGVKDAQLVNNVLTITRYDDTTITIDFKDIASASSVVTALSKKVDKTTSVTAGEGLTGGGDLTENREIKHGVTPGYTQKESGWYKFATDKFGHITSTTAVSKEDITGLGVPSSDTTYTFKGGTNKFTVTPKNGTDQEVTVTPSIANNVVKTSANTTVGSIPKFSNTTGTIEDGYSVQTSLSSSTTAIPTSSAVETAINSKIAAADAMMFKGTLGTSGDVTTVPASGYMTGWTYKVITAGTYAGVKCEVGDMLIALEDGPSSGTTVNNAHWTVVQTNIDGAVTGPTSSTANHVAIFDGTTGKVIKDSTFTIEKSVPSNAVFTDAHVTAVGNHYTPSATGATNVTETAGSAVAAGGKVITAVKQDAAGHVVGVTTGTIPVAQTLSGLGGVGTVSLTSDTLAVTVNKTGTTVALTADLHWEQF